MSELVDAAERYLALGMRIIALTGKAPNGAKGVHPHGLLDALGPDTAYTAYGQTAALEHLFNHPKTTGIGLLTGGPYFVIDIDGEEGAQQWQSIAGDFIAWPRWVAKTPRLPAGGLHLWFGDVTPRRTRKLGPKLDLKGEGGYVVAPPSLHPDGGRYEWLVDPDLGPPGMAPDALTALLDEQDWEFNRALVARAANKRVRYPAINERGQFGPSWGFEGVYRTVREAAEGNRNHALYWAAFTLVEDGATDDEFAELAQAGTEAGLTARETRLTIRSARRAAGD